MKAEYSILRAVRAVLTAFVLFFIAAGAVSPQQTEETVSPKKTLLTGSWYKRGITYRFDPDSTVTITKLGDGKSGYVRSPFRWFTLGIHDCISFRRDPADSLSLEVLLVGDVTDSTAVLALGTPFVRSGEGRGLPGVWKYLDHFTRMEWTFSLDAASYRKSVYSIDTGAETTVEEYSGTWARAEGDREPGTYILSFGGGIRCFVLPVVYRNMMYLFDVSPGKSYFSRGKSAPRTETRLTENSPTSQLTH